MNNPQTHESDTFLKFARTGDPQAAARVVELYHRCVYEYCYRILRNDADACDATQVTFLKLFRSARAFRGGCALKSWILRIATHQSLDMLRARQRRSEMEKSIDDKFITIPGPSSRASAGDAAPAVQAALARLPELYRIPVLLHYAQGLSYEETAGVLGCAAGTVASRLSVARERMREMLAAAGFAAVAPGWELLLKSPAAAPPAALAQKLQILAASTRPSAFAGVQAVAGAFAGTAAVSAAIVISVIFVSPSPGAATGSATLLAVRESDASGPESLQNPAPVPATAPAAPLRRVADAPPATNPAAGAPAAAEARKIKFTIHVTAKKDDSGAAAPGIHAWLHRVWPSEIVKTKKGPDVEAASDAEGRITLTAEFAGPAIYTLGARSGSGRTLSSADRVFEVYESREENIEIRMRPETTDTWRRENSNTKIELMAYLLKAFAREKQLWIDGAVQTENGAPPPTNCYLRVIDGEGDIFNPDMQFDGVTGRFVIGPLKPDLYILEAHSGPGGFAVAPSLDMRNGPGPTALVLTLRSGDARVRGRVTDPAGRPLAGAEIAAYPEALLDGGLWMTPSSTAKSDADGAFELLKTGREGELLRIVASHPDFRATVLHNTAAGSEAAQVALRPKPVVRGKIIFKNTGKPAARYARVRVEAAESQSGRKYKGSFQTMVHYSNVDEATGEFTYIVEGPGPAKLLVDRSLGDSILQKDIEIPDEGIDVGVIEIEARKDGK